MSVDEQRPVLAGLLALVGVAVAVGLVASVAVMGGAHLLGLGGGQANGGVGDVGATMYLPKPHKTHPAGGPSITLGTSPTQSTPTGSPNLNVKHAAKQITLQAGEQSVAPMGRIDLSGTYPGGEGAVLKVQKFGNGSWQDFYSISATVTNGTFSTYIETGTPGVNRFRVVDSDTSAASNQVKVTIR